VDVTIADINGDGIPDILIANFTGKAVEALYGKGDGAFSPAVALAEANGVYSIIADDVDHDGAVDLLFAGNGGVGRLHATCR
jgi:hypothetical protein